MRWAIFLVLTLILAIFFWGWGGSEITAEIPFYYHKILGKTVRVEINGVKIEAEIAQSSREKSRGLADRPELPQNRGMIFVYKDPLIPSFWMKGMRFPLDFIWIKDNIVVDITESVPTENGPDYPTYSPKEAANRILEVNAGLCQRYGIKIGQEVKYSKLLK